MPKACQKKESPRSVYGTPKRAQNREHYRTLTLLSGNENASSRRIRRDRLYHQRQFDPRQAYGAARITLSGQKRFVSVVELLRLYNKRPSELANEWLAFSLKQTDASLSLETLELWEQKELRVRLRSSSQSTDRHVSTRRSKGFRGKLMSTRKKIFIRRNSLEITRSDFLI